MSNFQTKVNAQQAPAVAGDIASQNPRANVLAGEAQLVAPAGGLIVGNFAFVTPATGVVSQKWASGNQIGFLARNLQALITTFLAGDTQNVPQGFPVVLFDEGDFYAFFAGGATAGQHVFADETNGSPVSAASAEAAFSATGLVGTAADIAGSITAGVLTVTAVSASGKIMPGDTLGGTGLTGNAIHIVAQLTGTTGGSNGATFSTDYAGTVPAFTDGQVVRSSYISFSAVGSGALVPGVTLVSALLQPNSELGAQITGSAGAAGIYGLVPRQNAIASGTITGLAGIDTGFIVRSSCAAGELAIISTWGV